jgi:hypothetical protein
MFTHSKDPQVFDRQLEQKSLLLKADLVAQTSEAASIVSMSGLIAARTISIDVKEAVKSVEKVQVVNRATGSNAGISAAPSISGNVISVTLDATGLSDVCIVVDYRN